MKDDMSGFDLRLYAMSLRNRSVSQKGIHASL